MTIERFAAVDPHLVASANHDNIVQKWHEANDDEKAQGMRWYEDAHHVSKAIAKGDAVKGAGLVATYSPQTAWPSNLFNASRAMREGKGIGGPGSGIMASDQQRRTADKVLAGAHYDDVFGPSSHKVRAFAHLIHHAGMSEHDPKVPSSRVCIDRHALSVGVGRRLTSEDFDSAGLSSKKRYTGISNHYVSAAAEISEHEKKTVAPHQVQAVTWLAQQRQNQQADEGENWGGRGRNQGFENAKSRWQQTADEHHPDIPHAPSAYVERPSGLAVPDHAAHPARPSIAGRKHAFGETKAPDNVDTLREEKCPVCGETDAYDGDQCQVCGYVTPPAMFNDPDLTKAKQMDLRADPASGAPNDQDPTVHDLAPVDPEAVNDEGAVEGEEATTADQDTDGDGTVDVETRSLGDEQNDDPNGDDAAEDGEEDEDGEPVDPEDLDEDGQVSPEEAQVAEEQDQVDADAEDVKAQEAADDGENVAAPVDPDAAAQHFDQGGEAFTPGPDAPTPEEPMEPGAQVGEQAPDGQEATGTDEVPGEPGDGIADLMCPACGFEADAATPTSTPGSASMPADEGDGATAGAVCPNCQGATLMSTGEINAMTGAK